MIYLIRHGQTAMNRTKVLQGRSDVPLNEAGVEEARAAGDWFKTQNIVFNRVYSSPLRRAVQTAKQIAGYLDIRTDERLTEMDYGPFEGMDLINPYPEVLDFFRDFVHVPAPQGMEPLDQVVIRLGQFLEELKLMVSSEENVLISTHAIAMKGALEYLTPGSDGKYWSKYIGNCEAYITVLENGKFRVPAKWEMKCRINLG